MADPCVVARRRHRRRGDDGFVGGAEGMLFGVVVFVFGLLLMFNAWAVVDAKMAVSSVTGSPARSLATRSIRSGPMSPKGRKSRTLVTIRTICRIPN